MKKVLAHALTLTSILAAASVAFAVQPEEKGQLGPRTADRVAGWNYTIVTTNNTRPNSLLLTYQNETGNSCTQHLLAKLVPGIETSGKTLWTSSASDVHVDDFPGGVKASYKIGNVTVSTEIAPLLKERGSSKWAGAAMYTIKTTPSTPVVIKCGGGQDAFMHFSPVEWVVTESTEFEGSSAGLQNGLGILRSTKHPLSVLLTAQGADLKKIVTEKGQYLEARFTNGTGRILLTFGKEESDALALTKLDTKTCRGEIAAYYNELLSSAYVETPEKDINAAFRSAIYNLEYNYVQPFGWVEGLHHWVTLWHQQHTGGAEWLGQAERARQSIIETAARAFPNGAMPHLSPAGLTRRDFGGSNQFYAYELRHYFGSTGDVQTLRTIAPAFYKSIEQTFQEYDSDNDGLLDWELQIGNQEDFIMTPYNGTSPTVEGINILRTGVMVAAALGDTERAVSYERRAQLSIARLREHLWRSDLGRFVYYKDPFGVDRLDGQYETFTYPVIYNLLDPLDSWTSTRHLRDRLIGPQGELYVSNNFPDHLTDVFATWGMQAGAEQQPWGACALSKIGLRNEAYRPLKAIASWVMNDFHKGAWPEVGREQRLAYFSAPAGQFIQSVCEALFGLQINLPAGCMTVAPSFPDSWPKAKLVTPDYAASYARKGNNIEYTVESTKPLARQVRWMLAPCKVEKILANGKAVDFKLEQQVGCVKLALNTAPAKKTVFTIITKPLAYKIDCPGSIAEGDNLRLNVRGLQIERVDDRCGVLSGWKTNGPSGLKATVRTGLLKPYMPYGRLGQMMFSRRTFFLLCKSSENVRFWLPIDITVLPAYEAAPAEEVSSNRIRLMVRNNTFSSLKGAAYVSIAGRNMPFEVSLQPRSEETFAISLPADIASLLSPGDNKATLVLPGERTIDLTLNASKLVTNSATASETEFIPLPAEALVSSAAWKTQRKFYSRHAHWAGCGAPLAALAGESEIAVPGLPNVNFKLNGDKYAIVSQVSGKRELSLDLGNVRYKKIYLLVCPLIDNHDIFSPVTNIRLVATKGAGEMVTSDAILTRTLYFPGDLDWWYPQEVVGKLATNLEDRAHRFGLLPLLGKNLSDWTEAQPPMFPQPKYWATSMPFRTKSAVLGVVEMDLGVPTALKSLVVSLPSVDAAIGIVSVSGERAE